jgi:hypothetical protein
MNMKIEIKKMETITTQQKISQFVENQAFSQNENINLSYQSFFRFWKQKQRTKQYPFDFPKSWLFNIKEFLPDRPNYQKELEKYVFELVRKRREINLIRGSTRIRHAHARNYKNILYICGAETY